MVSEPTPSADEGRSPAIPQPETASAIVKRIASTFVADALQFGACCYCSAEEMPTLRLVVHEEGCPVLTVQYLAELAERAVVEDLTRLREDQADWRKGVALIASALGDPADNLSCVRIAELALQVGARAEAAEAELSRLRDAHRQLIDRIENGHTQSIGSLDNVRMVQFGIDEIARYRQQLASPAPGKEQP